MVRVLSQSAQLLLSLADEFVQVTLADEQGRFGTNVVPIVAQLCSAQIATQELEHNTLTTVQVLLQLTCIFLLTAQLPLLLLQGRLDTQKHADLSTVAVDEKVTSISKTGISVK